MAENKKTYTVTINGLKQPITDATKLKDALDALDSSLNKTREANVKVEQSTRQTAKALSDEEKAAQRLANTQKRIAKVNDDANRAQIEANIELRERTRELTRQIQISKFAEGSMKEMGMTITDLRNEYEELTKAQRDDEAVGGKLLVQLQALDKEYKGLRESTGNFRDSVGNYEKASAGLEKLRGNFNQASNGAVQLASDLGVNNDILKAFGSSSEGVAQSLDSLQNILVLATLASQTYSNITKEATLTQQAAAVIDGIRTVQLKAKAAAEALATKNTWLAIIAQKALNLVAAANPYVILALAILSVVGALVWFASRTDEAAEKQKKLNDLQALFLDQLDREADKLRKVGAERVKAAERALQLLQAQGAATGKIRSAEDVLARERAANNARLRGFYGEELASLEANRKKIEQLTIDLDELNKRKLNGEDKIWIDVDLDGNLDRVKIDEVIDAVQGQIDNTKRSVNIAVDLQTEQDDLAQAAKVASAERAKADREAAKERAAKAAEARRVELEAVRSGEDARLALIKSSYDRQRQEIAVANRRAIEDLRERLRTETNLTAKARAAINDNIVSLQKQLGIELASLEEEQQKQWEEIQRGAMDSRTRLIRSDSERQREELRTQYDRQIEDLHTRIAKEGEITQEEGKLLTETLLNLQKERDQALARLAAQSAQQRSADALAAVESTLSQIEARTGELVKRSKTGLELIDVDGTRKNLKTVNEALKSYVNGVQQYRKDLTEAHEATLATLQKDSPEYEAEVQKYADAMEAASQRIIKAQKQQTDNAKVSKNLQIEYYRDLVGKIGELAGVLSDTVGSVLDTVSMGIQAQVDDMASQLENINTQYEKAKENREKAVEQVETLESRMQDATGGTAQALKEQLADATTARNEANREEQRLAKEKEKREAEIARKEKQMRRNDLLANIAQGISNAAQAVTKALTLAWPLNMIIAPIVGAAGAAQVGIMTRQLAKLAKGGPIKGPLHDNGGVNIVIDGKPSYEAQGGEFMINDKSYSANPEAVEFINSAEGPVSLSDLAGMLPAGVPEAAELPVRTADDRITEALQSINFAPVVSVQDINDVQDEVAEVKDLAGFN